MAEKQSHLRKKVNETVAEIHKHTGSAPKIGIILGTGLGGVLDEIEIDESIYYDTLPHFPVSTVKSHVGRLLFSKIHGKEVVAMQGRFHYYEGYSMQKIGFPVRVMRELGVQTLIITNACGSLHPSHPKGNVMIIEDHINLLGDNPLIGEYDEYFGPRFVDMSEPYNREYIRLAEDIALENKIKVYRGVYAAMSGPSLETRAEYRFLRQIGADVVGMSTIPECIVARQMGIDVLGMSLLTDECYPDALLPVSIEEILETAKLAEPKLTKLILDFIKRV